MNARTGSIFVYRVGRAVAAAALIAALALGTVCALPLAVPTIRGLGSFPAVRQLAGAGQTLVARFAALLPQGLQDRQLPAYLAFAASLLLAVLALALRGHFGRKIRQLEAFRQYEAFRVQRPLAPEAPALAELRTKIDGLGEESKPEDREALLRLFSETKKKLDALSRDLAFLAVDVVDSTGMKAGEEPGIVEHNFREYKKLVEGKLKEYGALKSAWTPDGVMICLPSVDVAVRLAQDLIASLDGFNKHVKTMKRDFQVRCGINFGYVYFDPGMPMQEMSDRVIDVAGHMQKNAAPNTVAIAKQAIEPVQIRDGFVTAGRIIDGYEVYVWTKDGPATP